MLLLATSDAPGRSEAPDPEASSEPAAEEEHATSPERTPEIESGKPEPTPPRPEPPERHEPEIVPPTTPEITPPDAPDITPPASPEIEPPATPEITPPDLPEITPPGSATDPARAPLASAPPSEPQAETKTAQRPPLQRAALALLIIAAAALIGYALSRPGDRDAGPDALARSIEAAGHLRLVLETDTPSEARQFVRDEFGWRVGVPVFEATPLRGVAIAQTAPAVEVPVFLYADAEGRNVAVFAYSYALLDQIPDRLRLTDADYDDLADGAPFVRRADGQDVVLWRDRDDIYVAVTDLPPDALTGGLAMAR